MAKAKMKVAWSLIGVPLQASNLTTAHENDNELLIQRKPDKF